MRIPPISLAGAIVLVALMAVPAWGLLPVHAVPAPGAPVHTSVLSSSAPASATPSYGADTWQEFQHDSSNSGASGDTPVASSVNWRTNLSNFPDGPDAPYVSSPVVGQGMVFLATGDNVTAYNVTTGDPVWYRALNPTDLKGLYVDGTPLLWRGMLFLSQDTDGGAGGPGECVGAPPCSTLFAINATNGTIMQSVPEGTPDGWEGGQAPGSPVPLAGAGWGGQSGILVPDWYGYLYTYTWNGAALAAPTDNARTAGERSTSTPSIALLPGVGPGGAPVWAAFYLDGEGAGGGMHQQVQGFEYTAASPFPAAPGYPAGRGLGGGQTLTWVSDNTGSIAIANVSAGGTTTWPTGFFGDNAGPGATSHLVAMNLSAHSYPGVGLLSTTHPYLDSGLLSTPAIVSDTGTTVGLVVADLNGTVSRWNFTTSPTGGSLVQMWNRSLGSPLEGSPSVAGDVVYVANSTGGVFALSSNTGNVEWSATLSSDTRSNFALGYSRLFVVSDPVGGGTTANLTAFGPPPGPQRNDLVATASTVSPIASGGTSMVVAHVLWSPAHIGSGGPASSATVNFTATSPAGSWQVATAPVNAYGYAYDNWTSPSSSPVWYNATITLQGWAPYNVSTSTMATVEVMPGSGVVVAPMSVSASPGVTDGLQAGDTQTVTFTATTTGGAPVAGASLALWLNGLGSLTNAGPLVTGANGQVTDTFAAPATIPAASSTLLTVNGTKAGFASAYASAAFGLVPSSSTGPSSAYPWSATASPTATSIAVGGTAQIAVTFLNETSQPSVPLAGLLVTGSNGGSASGSLSAPTATTNAQGTADFTFTATEVPGAALLTFTASQEKGTATTSASVAVEAPGGALEVTWSAVASPNNATIEGGNSTQITVTLENTSASPATPLSGVTVTASTGDSASGSLPETMGTTNSQGMVTFTFVATKVPGAVLLTFTASQGRGSASTSASISVFNPSSSTTTPSSTTSSGLSQLDWLLIIVIIALAALLIVSLVLGRRSRYRLPTYPSSASAAAPAPAEPPATGGPSGGAGGLSSASPVPAATVAAGAAGVAAGAAAGAAGPTSAEEDTSPISVEDEPDGGGGESAPTSGVDHEKLAAGLGAALAASGADADAEAAPSEAGPSAEAEPAADSPSAATDSPAPPEEDAPAKEEDGQSPEETSPPEDEGEAPTGSDAQEEDGSPSSVADDDAPSSSGPKGRKAKMKLRRSGGGGSS